MLAFIHPPKIGGTTINWLLRSSFGIRHCDVEPWGAMARQEPLTSVELRWLQRIHPGLRSIAGHRVKPYADLETFCDDMRYFTFMRDPIKRTASFYQYVVKRPASLDFEHWVRQDWVRNQQTRFLAGKEDVNAAIRQIETKHIFVGLTENFDESIVLLQRLLVPEINIAYERKNVAKDNSIASNILESDKYCRLIEEVSTLDLELYEYVKTTLFPIYRRAYGPTLEADLAHYQQDRGHVDQRNVRLNRAYRNAVYKPALRLLPWYSRAISSRIHHAER